MGRGLSFLEERVLVGWLTPSPRARESGVAMCRSEIGWASPPSVSRCLYRLEKRGLIEFYFAQRCLPGKGILGIALTATGRSVANTLLVNKVPAGDFINR